MSTWTHSLCEPCWRKGERGHEEPQRYAVVTAMCCVCGEWHRSGIWFRADPAKVACKGNGPTHAGDDPNESPSMLALHVGERIVTIALDDKGNVRDGGSLARFSGLEPHEVEPFVVDVLVRVIQRLNPRALDTIRKLLAYGPELTPPRVTVTELDTREMGADEAKDGYALRDQVAALVGGKPFVLVVPYDDPKRSGWMSRGVNLHAKGFDGGAFVTLFAALLQQAEVTNLREGVPMEVFVRRPRGDA